MPTWHDLNGTGSLQDQHMWEGYTTNSELLNLEPEQAVYQTQQPRRQLWNNDFLRPPVQSIPMPFHPPSMTGESSVYTEPELTSHGTSRKSSGEAPYTPNMPRRAFMPPNDVSYFHNSVAGPSDQLDDQGHFDLDPKVDHLFMGGHLSTPLCPTDLSNPLTSESPQLRTIPEQSWNHSFPTPSSPSSQQQTTIPRQWLTSDRPPDQCIESHMGAWQMDDDSFTRYQQGEGESRLEAGNAACQDHHVTASHALAGADYMQSHEMNDSTIVEEVLLVNCKQCGKPYTGRWRVNNMQRHFRQKHTTPKKYVCQICFKSYQRIDALRFHERQQH